MENDNVTAVDIEPGHVKRTLEKLALGLADNLSDETAQFGMRLRKSTIQRIDEEAKRYGLNRSELARQLLESALADLEEVHVGRDNIGGGTVVMTIPTDEEER